MSARWIRIGPLLLREVLGRGGMGEVWAGEHSGLGLPVAVKVLTHELAREPRFHRAFQEEVRALARLDHPHIVQVLDAGVVPRATAVQARGRLPEGSPYLVMELAGRRTVDAWKGRLPWEALRSLLLTLLDALAHAHARGVLHLDIKPANVLLSLRPPPGPRLTDFGLAQALDERPAARRGVVGTPDYMAPERIRGQAHLLGPATDLYGVGCLAWELAAGRPPFHRSDRQAILDGHLYREPPALAALQPVAPGFESWLRRLLGKDPNRRYQRAADAAWALARLPPPEEPAPEEAPDLPHEETTVALTAELLQGLPPDADTPLDDDGPPPIPADWRGTPAARARLPGLGLGVAALRRPPLVGRGPERDLLWRRLREVARTHRPALVVLAGPRGVGRTRLAKWLAERAHETGAAEVVRAAPEGGLEGMAREALALGATRGAELRAQLRRRLPGAAPDELASWAAWMDPSAGASPTLPEQLALLRRWWAAARRPVVAILDDLDLAPDLLELARSLLAAERPAAPVLAVGTAAAPPPLAGAEVLDLSPLEPAEVRALVADLLDLAPEVVNRVVERTGGLPLFVRQVIEDWAERGALRPGPRGYVLAEEVPVTVPVDLRRVWETRLARALRGRPATDREHLEVAALLGLAVEPDLWAAAAAHAGLPPSPDLPAAMVDAGILRRGPGERLRFAHELMRETLAGAAREAGRDRRHHAACAAALRNRGGPGTTARLAEHLLAAHEGEDAVEPLLAAVDEHLGSGRHGEALALLRRAEQLLDALRLPAADPRRGALRAREATAHAAMGEADRAERALDRLEAGVRAHGWRELEGELELARAHLALRRGGLEAARVAASRAEAAFGRPGREAGRARAATLHAEVLVRLGEPTRARAAAERAVQAAERIQDTLALAAAWLAMAEALPPGPDAASFTRISLEAARRGGHRGLQARAETRLAELAWGEGALDRALDHARAALGTVEAFGLREPTPPRLVLGLALLEAGAVAEARTELVAVLDAPNLLPWLAGPAHFGLACCAALEGDASGWTLHHFEARAALERPHVLPGALARVAWRAGHDLLRRGEPAFARGLWRLARAAYHAAGMAHEARTAEDALAMLDPPAPAG